MFTYSRAMKHSCLTYNLLMGQKPVESFRTLTIQCIFSTGLFTVCTMLKQMRIHSSFPELKYFQQFLKGKRCLLIDYEYMKDNLEKIMKLCSFYLYSYKIRVGQCSQSYLTTRKCTVGFF